MQHSRHLTSPMRFGQVLCLAAMLATLAPSVQAAEDYLKFGTVSHYHQNHSGDTASGELYDPRLFTAAHPTLPFGTRVRVTELRSGRSCVVRVNDRSAIVTGNAIDVSYAAARELGVLNSATAEVSVTALREQRDGRSGDDRGLFDRLIPVSADSARIPPSYQDNGRTNAGRNANQAGEIRPPQDGQSMNRPAYRVQFGAYKDWRNAEADLAKLRSYRVQGEIFQQSGTTYPYRLLTSGVFYDRTAADRWVTWLKTHPGFPFQDAYITR